MGVRMITDSTSYLPEDVREEHGIRVVSLGVVFEDGTSVLEEEVGEDFYERLSRERAIPTSFQPPLAELMEAYTDAVEAGDDVVSVFISSDMSGTFSAAEQARAQVLETHPDARIEVIDSRSNCMELGLAVLEGARAAHDGPDAAVEAVERAIDRTRFLFVPASLEHLRKGGRIGGASALVGQVLQVKPILTVSGGTTQVHKKVRTMRRALDEIVGTLEDDARRKGLEEVVVHHIDDQEAGRALAARVEETTGMEAPVVPIGPVVGIHVGPGAVAVVYRTAEPMEKGGAA